MANNTDDFSEENQKALDDAQAFFNETCRRKGETLDEHCTRVSRVLNRGVREDHKLCAKMLYLLDRVQKVSQLLMIQHIVPAQSDEEAEQGMKDFIAKQNN